MDNLADRFEISATRWARAIEAVERAYPIPTGSLDDEAREGFSLDREEDAVAHAGARLLASQAITSVRLELYEIQAACESPIEMPMLLALMTVARHEGVSVKRDNVRASRAYEPEHLSGPKKRLERTHSTHR